MRKEKRGFPFSYKSTAYAIDLAARPWAAKQALISSALPKAQKLLGMWRSCKGSARSLIQLDKWVRSPLMISDVLFISAGMLSLLAARLIFVCVQKGGEDRSGNAMQRNISLLVAASIAATLLAILEQGFIGPSGLVLTLTTVAGFTTLLVQNLYLVGMWKHGVRGLGLLLLPLTAIPLLAMPFLPEETSEQWVEAHSFLQTGHLLLSVVAYAMLTMAALYAVMQLQLDKALNQKKIGFWVQAMPSLMDITNYLFVHVRWAIWLLGLSILTGLAWQWVEMHHFALFTHKVLLAVIAWCVLMVLYFQWKKAAWHHNRGSKMVLFAYVTLMLAYFGVKIIKDVI